MGMGKLNYVLLEATLLHSCQVDDGSGAVSRRKRPLYLLLLLGTVLIIVDRL